MAVFKVFQVVLMGIKSSNHNMLKPTLRKALSPPLSRSLGGTKKDTEDVKPSEYSYPKRSFPCIITLQRGRKPQFSIQLGQR